MGGRYISKKGWSLPLLAVAYLLAPHDWHLGDLLARPGNYLLDRMERLGEPEIEQPPPAGLSILSIQRPPNQKDLGLEGPHFRFGDYRLQALAGFSLTARVLSAQTYAGSSGDALSPLDLAVGWGHMAEPTVIAGLSIAQGERLLEVSWSGKGGPPIPSEQITAQSANMHMIPASREIRKGLLLARPGAIVRLRGYLVEARLNGDLMWRSSLTRTDTGDGACEVFFVQEYEIEPSS